MVVGVGDDNLGVGGADEAVFAVPEVMKAAIGGHIAVDVVGELLRRFGDEDDARGSGNNVGGVGAGRVNGGVNLQLLGHG